jgi:catalase (peroxidase I)
MGYGAMTWSARAQLRDFVAAWSKVMILDRFDLA